MPEFNWDTIQYRDDGKILLLYRHERVLEDGLIKPGSLVVDIGGWGQFTERVIQEGGRCIVWDLFTPDQYYSERVKKNKHKNVDICSDSTYIYIHKDVFDIVTCFETLEHVADQTAAIRNMFSILRPTGYLAGTVPIPGYSHAADEPGIKFLNENQLKDLLVEAGFENIFIEPTGSVHKEDTPSCLYFKAQKPEKS